ncbi:sulfotransferase family protein [Aeribacillus alveayuensis]|uniref:Sulfotransferase domain-containing protein n=1 Tax=Aeribacillus alveayuensis TaxID=279215 RepID=A0ABT9VNL4_9BACI|nr:hypothetical protein [Bacillus alveayuensis]
MKPNFLCVGAQKSGTTTLHDLLIQHPDIYLPTVKETKFFQDNKKFEQGIDFYEKMYFSRCKSAKAVGEIDPEYMYFEEVPERIYKSLGKDIKIIFMLRNPADRAYSHYLMSYRRDYEKHSFIEAINLERERISLGDFEKNHFSYVDRGFYAKQIKRYLKYFPLENMKFIIFEEFVKNKKSVLSDIFSFLGVSQDVDIQTDLKSNEAGEPKFKFLRDFIYKPNYFKPLKRFGRIFFPTQQSRDNFLRYLDKINQGPLKSIPKSLALDIREKLINIFFDDIKELENIIGINLGIWLDDKRAVHKQ